MNMPYCRFQNTASDLRDCYQNLTSLNPADRSFNEDRERESRRDLILTCAQILQELGVDDVFDERDLLDRIANLDDCYEEEPDD